MRKEKNRTGGDLTSQYLETKVCGKMGEQKIEILHTSHVQQSDRHRKVYVYTMLCWEQQTQHIFIYEEM